MWQSRLWLEDPHGSRHADPNSQSADADDSLGKGIRDARAEEITGVMKALSILALPRHNRENKIPMDANENADPPQSSKAEEGNALA